MKKNKQQQYLGLLQKNDLFKNIEPDVLTTFAGELSKEKWPKNSCSIGYDKCLFRFYILISGRVKIYRTDAATGREFTLFLLTKNDVFDVLCLLQSREHKVYYEALDDVVLLSIPIEKMRKWLRDLPELNKMLLLYMAHQLRMLEQYASDVTLTDTSTRLAKLILSNVNGTSHQLELINDLSNDELANLIGSTRAVVNRHLQEFKSDGSLRVGRKKVEIKNLKVLLDRLENRKE
ncbi:MAG: Crp/Fnr family transcriptional regulator [Salegentibacter sp.]